MGQRLYNVFFHTHTISGIVISALLYVIFFTGSISFLRDEINAWERNEPIKSAYFSTIDFDQALNELSTDKPLYGRDLMFNHRYFERRLGATMTKSKDTTIQDAPQRGRRGNFFYMDMDTFKKEDYTSNYSLGEFFYRLHFFAQLNFFSRSGYYLSGFVAFFFLFAVITGVIVHWKKIIPSFYLFRPKGKWKNIWTDAHVALGMIGLPYQFMFALTGCFLIIGYMVMFPPVQSFIYGNDVQAFTKDIQYEENPTYEFTYQPLETVPSINDFVARTLNKWPDIKLTALDVINYGDQSMHVKIYGAPDFDQKLLGTGHITYRVQDGQVVNTKDPYGKISYAEGSLNLLRRLHYGDFGGYGMKLIYLLLGFITCFVILSGVLIWLVARDKKHVAPAKRIFNKWLVHIYMAACLSLYPVTAATFTAIKVFGSDLGDTRQTFMYHVFFYSWLGLSLVLIALRNNYLINKICLILGSILALCVPVANGLVTGNWPWVSWSSGFSQIFVVDLFWILMSLSSIAVVFKLNNKDASKASTVKRSQA